MNHKFIIMWDNTGLEYIGDATPDLQTRMWDTLRGATPKDFTVANPMHLRLRAQANPQRHYEIYIIEAMDGITSDDIRSMFKANPQMAAATIRNCGHCFYRYRESRENVVIV